LFVDQTLCRDFVIELNHLGIECLTHGFLADQRMGDSGPFHRLAEKAQVPFAETLTGIYPLLEVLESWKGIVGQSVQEGDTHAKVLNGFVHGRSLVFIYLRSLIVAD